MLRELLYEGVRQRKLVRRVAIELNAINKELNARTGRTPGKQDEDLVITTKTKQIPAEVHKVLKKLRIGVGNIHTTKNDDGTFDLKFYIMEL